MPCIADSVVDLYLLIVTLTCLRHTCSFVLYVYDGISDSIIFTCSSSSIADDTREARKLGSKVISEEDEDMGEDESVSQLRESFIAERDQKVTVYLLVELVSPELEPTTLLLMHLQICMLYTYLTSCCSITCKSIFLYPKQ